MVPSHASGDMLDGPSTVSVPGAADASPAFLAWMDEPYMRTAAVPPPAMYARARFRSKYAAANTNSADCTRPTCTHFISVDARAPALISVVCGLEHAAAMISYTIPADTRKAIPFVSLDAAARSIAMVSRETNSRRPCRT